MRPSRAAILFSDTSPGELEELVKNVLLAKKYTSTKDTVPRGYPAYVGEWLGFVVTRSDDLRVTVLVPEDISQVFTIALWIAEHSPDLAFCAWRGLQGMDPVLKFYAQGRPQFRDGPDRDLEVMWSIPAELPTNMITPSEIGLPSTATQVQEAIGTALEPYSAQVRTLGSQDIRTAFLDRKSPLA